MKVAINCCYGGFGLSQKAFIELMKRKGITVYADGTGGIFVNYWKTPIEELPAILKSENWSYPKTEEHKKAYEAAGPVYPHQYLGHENRTDPDLIAVIEQFGDEASSSLGEVKIVEVPDDVSWEIKEYDGIEWVAETHRTWS